jgi:hypothetical protein
LESAQNEQINGLACVARTLKDHKTLARIRAAAEKPVRILPYSAGKAGVIDKPPAGIGAILKEANPSQAQGFAGDWDTKTDEGTSTHQFPLLVLKAVTALGLNQCASRQMVATVGLTLQSR